MRFILTKFFWSCFTLTTITLQCSMAQSGEEEKGTQITFEELKTIWYNADQNYLDKYFDIHVAKAKKEKDTLELAQAYRYRAWDLNFEDGLKSLDSAITIVNSMNQLDKAKYNEFMGRVLYAKSAIFYSNYKDEQATETLIQSFHFVKKVNDKELMIMTLSELANLKAEFGQESEAILLQNKTLDFIEKNQNAIADYRFYHLYGLQNMVRCYTFSKKVDSARLYLKKAIKMAIETKNTNILQDLREISAEVDYHSGDILRAKDTLSNYVKNTTGTSRADKLFYLGQIEGKLGKLDLKKNILGPLTAS